ncbi:unnamed protein product [Acanthoscelides obtectus]|uniref:Uncharacterized protein n=1 Tax=Acanthoscelides obtectus TaxID=200917 RepID=A0A9P0P133_ACAOB|nr:unnamed protein product [Acanthoscelides obtectus]CAK1649393.1 hypothetical protein AOBTE_LOCUS16213 [Acanthoscelides obtectus]
MANGVDSLRTFNHQRNPNKCGLRKLILVPNYEAISYKLRSVKVICNSISYLQKKYTNYLPFDDGDDLKKIKVPLPFTIGHYEKNVVSGVL